MYANNKIITQVTLHKEMVVTDVKQQNLHKYAIQTQMCWFGVFTKKLINKPFSIFALIYIMHDVTVNEFYWISNSLI